MIGYDIDGCLANFIQAFLSQAQAMGLGPHFPDDWTQWDSWQPVEQERFSEVWWAVRDDHAFWLSIPVFEDAAINTPAGAYVTARPVPSNVTKAWLVANGFPEAPVFTVGPGASKKPVLKDLGITQFVDDRPATVRELNGAGIRCLMPDRPHNQDADLDPYRFYGGLQTLTHNDDTLYSKSLSVPS